MSANFTQLSKGSVQKIMGGEQVPCPIILQVLGSRRVSSTSGADSKNRYRLLVSDGVTIHSFAMLSTDLNNLYESNELADNTIIQVNRYVCSVVNKNDANERRVVILFELAVLHSGAEVGKKIGNPEMRDGKSVPLASASGASAAPQKENQNVNSRAAATARNPYQKREENFNQSINSSSANLNEHLTMPIDSISPYQNKWVIKARVTSKSIIRTWSNQKGEGKLFSFDLCDETGEIRATAFREQVDKFYDLLEVDKVYYITKCQLKTANKQYSKLRNDYEMTLTNETVIQECTDPTQIPEIKYNFVPISDLGTMEAGAIVDVIGVCKESSDLTNLTSKQGRELTKREVTLVDQSSASIQLTLWGDEARNFDGFEQPVLLVKGAKVGEYGGGKTLGTAAGTCLKLNPDVTEGHVLRGWYDNDGAKGEIKHLSSRTQGNYSADFVNFHQAKLNNLGAGDKADYFQVKGFIHNIRSSNAFYKACANQDCNKKVVDQDNGLLRCDKCNIDSPNFKYRLLVNMLVGDWTSNRWVTAFSDVAELLLGKTSQEIGELLEHDKEAADAIFTEISFQQKTFKLRTKIETYQDVPKNKMTVMAISEPNYKEYNKHLLANIQRLTGIHKMETS